jgi:hypothetical protein
VCMYVCMCVYEVRAALIGAIHSPVVTTPEMHLCTCVCMYVCM